jgi:hypothetical protein
MIGEACRESIQEKLDHSIHNPRTMKSYAGLRFIGMGFALKQIM